MGRSNRVSTGTVGARQARDYSFSDTGYRYRLSAPTSGGIANLILASTDVNCGWCRMALVGINCFPTMSKRQENA